MTPNQEHPTTPTPQQVANFVIAAATETETHGWVGGPEAATAITTLVRSLVDVALKLPHTDCDDDFYACASIHPTDRFGDCACDCGWAERALAILRPIANLYGVDPKGTP